MIERLAEVGVPEVRCQGVSDLAVGDRKIGGSCIYRTKGLLLYGTTLLVDPELSLLKRYLPHPPREPEYRRGRSHAEFVTSLAELGLPADVEKLRLGLEKAARRGLPELEKQLALIVPDTSLKPYTPAPCDCGGDGCPSPGVPPGS